MQRGQVGVPLRRGESKVDYLDLRVAALGLVADRPGHPSCHVSVVIKSKVLRLKSSSEVTRVVDCQKIQSYWSIEMPKINENAPTLFGKSKARAEKEERPQRLNGERKGGDRWRRQEKSAASTPFPGRPAARPSASMADLLSRTRRRDGKGRMMVAVDKAHLQPPPPAAVAGLTTTTTSRRRPASCNFTGNSGRVFHRRPLRSLRHGVCHYASKLRAALWP